MTKRRASQELCESKHCHDTINDLIKQNEDLVQLNKDMLDKIEQLEKTIATSEERNTINEKCIATNEECIAEMKSNEETLHRIINHVGKTLEFHSK